MAVDEKGAAEIAGLHREIESLADGAPAELFDMLKLVGFGMTVAEDVMKGAVDHETAAVAVAISMYAYFSNGRSVSAMFEPGAATAAAEEIKASMEALE